MKPVIELIKKTDDHNPAEPVVIVACGKCGQVYPPHLFTGADDEQRAAAARRVAEACCEPRLCGACDPAKPGGPAFARKGYLTCDDCWTKNEARREQERIDKAEQLTVAQCTYPVVYNDDDFFDNVEDLLEHLHHNCDLEDDDYPVVAWCCNQVAPQLDIEAVIDHFHENLELADGVEFNTVVQDLPALRAALAAWNEKQKPTLYVPSDKRCVIIHKADVVND